MSHHSLSDSAADPVERKVQLTGNSTFVVSLPKAWALDQGLESGMSMYLYPHDDRVVAAPEHVSGRDRSVTIEATAVEGRTVVQRVRAAYTTGYDRITVTGTDRLEADTRRELERTVGRLIGIEIQDVTDDQLSIANLLDASEVSLPQTVAQARQLALELHGDAVDALLSNDDELARQVQNRNGDVDRLFAFVSRGFHRGLEDVREVGQLETDRTVAFREYRIARQLTRIADRADRIAAVALRQSDPPDDALRERIESVTTDTRTVVDAALAGEFRSATETHSAVRASLTSLNRQLHGQSDADARLYRSVFDDLRQTADIGIEIAETTLEASVAQRETGVP
ncbi:phosphate signaling complex PhoU family protein [Natronorubrum halophilum]|uniref:phosphate signaling complex PhoU family protein n=1 Tax=Natronorubrum halophilum TaxID=1702106 RepID=UPI0010C17927|nr:phosphate uptake regulator PhoU [Natronorubrum halophilum]